MRPVSNLRLPKEQKQQIREKLSEKSVEGIKTMNFSLKTHYFQLVFKSNWISFFINIISKIQQI